MRIRAFARMRLVLLLVGLAFVALPVSSALADIGELGGGTFTCVSDVWLDVAYVVPSGGGTITAFSFQSDGLNSGQQLDFLALRPVTGGYTVVGKTGLVTLAGTGVETFSASIPVQAGDVLGYWTSGLVNCAHSGSGIATMRRIFTLADPSIDQALLPIQSVWYAGPNLNESAKFTPAAPVVTTAPATGITTTRALLNGTVNTNGVSATYHFDYGTTTDYGSQTIDASLWSDSLDHAVSLPAFGLAADTTYHFRIVATSFAGTSYGTDQTFTTPSVASPPPPPPPRYAPSATTNAPSAVSASGATLNGTVNPQGQASTYRFEYGTSVAYGSHVPSSDAPVGSDFTGHPVSQRIAGLLPSTTYHYRIVTRNASGTRYGPDRTFKTAPKVMSLRMTPARFRALGSGPTILLKGTNGTKVSYKLSDRGTVTFTIEQAVAGRRKGTNCLPQTRARRRLPRCTRYVVVKGSFKHTGKAGQVSFRFTGRFNGKTLKPGNYRLAATVRDSTGKLSAPVRVTFTLSR